MSKTLSTIVIIGATIAVFILTKNPFTSVFKLHMALIAILALIIYGYFMRKHASQTKQIKTFAIAVSITVLFIVAATGWYFSPFFFSLYLLAIFLSFMFAPLTSIGFVLTLVLLFAFDVGQINPAYDYLVLLSLLTIIPLSFYLKKEYLRLKEAEKDILIMKKEKKAYKNKVDDLLANKVNNLAVNLRQPVNDIKQLAFLLKKSPSKEETHTYIDRISTSSEEAIRILNKFEEEATGKKLLENPT
ncbi:MAG TPA: hypothetical protein VJH96_03775 [Patescibacteria group bacterium]|nr:hypothetical protein [Patescibacteria group bacterium]